MVKLARISTVELVDKERFKAYISERKPERFLRVLSIFAEELDAKVAKLAIVISDRDIVALQALTHSMLGSAVMLGVKRMVDISRDVEQSCHATQTVDWATVVSLQLTARDTAALFKSFRDPRSVEAFIEEPT